MLFDSSVLVNEKHKKRINLHTLTYVANFEVIPVLSQLVCWSMNQTKSLSVHQSATWSVYQSLSYLVDQLVRHFVMIGIFQVIVSVGHLVS